MSLIIPEYKISEIKSTANIVDVVSDVVFLKKAGRNHLGLCPFHSEKTPSFTVSPEKQMYYCFGCGAGGDIFEFLQKHEGVSFPEAALSLARRYGITVPERSMSVEQKKRLTEKESIFVVNSHTMKFFCHHLLHEPSGKKALAYLINRGIKKETVEHFSLGFAPAGWEFLLGYLKRNNIPLAAVEKSGVVVKRDGRKKGGDQRRSNGYYDRFRNRIMFPILDVAGQVIGFGGRVMDDALPKYLNSPETPVYNKSRSLYGVQSAKRKSRDSGRVFVVEGYMDLISLYQHGIENVVATLGTSLTLEHVRMLKGLVGHSGRVILVYDSDEAGIKAAKRSIGVFEQERVDTYILELPEGHDPDSFILEFGSKPFNALADKAMSAMFFLINSHVKTHGYSIEGNVRTVSEMTGPLSAISDNVKRSSYIKALAERTGIDESTIMERVRVAAKKNGDKTNQATGGRFSSVQPSGPAKGDNADLLEIQNKMEKRITAMMLQFPDILPEIDKRGILQYFLNETLKSIGLLILNHMKYDKEGRVELNMPDLMSEMDNAEQGRIVASLAIEDDLWEHKGCLKMIEQFVASRDRKKNTLIQKIKAAEDCNDHELLFKLLKEKQTQAKRRGRKTA